MPEQRHTEFSGLGFAALVIGGTTIGFSAIFVKLSVVGPTATAFYRLFLSLPLLLVWMRVHEQRAARHAPRPGWRPFLLLPGLFFALDIAMWHWSIRYTTIANATLLGNLAPIFVTIFAWALFRERVTRLFLLGLATALLGTALMMGTSLRLSPANLVGDALGVATAVFYGAYQLSIKRLRATFSTPMLLSYVALGGVPVLLVLTLSTGEPVLWWRVAPFWIGLLPLLGLAWVSQVFGQGAIVFGLQKLPASFSSVTLLIQPVVSAIAAWVLFGQALGPAQLFGAGVVLAGIFIAQQGYLRAARIERRAGRAP